MNAAQSFAMVTRHLLPVNRWGRRDSACQEFRPPAVIPFTSTRWVSMEMRTTGSLVRTPLVMIPAPLAVDAVR